ncbi:MAG TPA: nucleoside triphosphate pyrophosphohydrolase [Patescibacteria group bacterium]|nr:nucleoside triphosphate pyrophosphohydrolase [Patescibacteria group bacterium]
MSTTPIERLRAIMAKLRDPKGGCPWDVQQDFASVAPYTIEEAYEVADAIDRGDRADLREELGDLLLQVVFHARMAEEEGSFAFDDVVEGICDKMVRRHPHVFGDAVVEDAAAQTRAWEEHKRREKEGRADQSALAGVAAGLPEWMRALKLQKRAAAVGFEWPDVQPVLDKLHEEVEEVRAEFAQGADPQRLLDEVGDVLFVAVNLARHAGVDPSAALRHANAKFERRFRAMEDMAADRHRTTLSALDLATQSRFWDDAKRDESTR